MKSENTFCIGNTQTRFTGWFALMWLQTFQFNILLGKAGMNNGSSMTLLTSEWVCARRRIRSHSAFSERVLKWLILRLIKWDSMIWLMVLFKLLVCKKNKVNLIQKFTLTTLICLTKQKKHRSSQYQISWLPATLSTKQWTVCTLKLIKLMFSLSLFLLILTTCCMFSILTFLGTWRRS